LVDFEPLYTTCRAEAIARFKKWWGLTWGRSGPETPSLSGFAAVQASVVLLASLRAELDHLLADHDEIIRSHVTRGFRHLQRSLIVDDDLRAKWLAAFEKGETSCERMGGVHLLLHGIWATTRGRLVEFVHVPGTTIWWPASRHIEGERNPDVAVVGLQAPLSFLNADNFRADVLKVVGGSTPKPRLLVIEASGIVEIDFTAAQILLDLIKQCQADGLTVAMARLESTRAQQAFARFGIYDALPNGCIFHSVDEAVRALAGKN